MTDETGIPGKPFMGKNGKPRKTKPKGTKEKKAELDGVVTELFSEERKAADHARTPDRGKKRKRVQLGKGWTTALQKMEDEGMTMEQFVGTLTPEELARGRLRNADGTFRGAPAKWVPTEFHKECIRELMRRGKVLYQEAYIDAIMAMTTIATTPSVDVGQRIRAAQFVIERIEGKVPERLEVGVSEPWQELLTGIVATVPVEGGAAPMRQFAEATRGDDGEG